MKTKKTERAKREACWKFEVGGWRLEGRGSSLRAGLEAGDDKSSRAEARGLRAAGANLKRGRLGSWGQGWPERNAGGEGGGAICDGHALFYCLDTMTTTGRKDSAGAGKKG